MKTLPFRENEPSEMGQNHTSSISSKQLCREPGGFGSLITPQINILHIYLLMGSSQIVMMKMLYERIQPSPAFCQKSLQVVHQQMHPW